MQLNPIQSGDQHPASNSLSRCHVEQSETSAVAFRNFRVDGNSAAVSEIDRSPTEGAEAFRPLNRSLQ